MDNQRFGQASARGFMMRLLRDARGNTLAIVAAALIPLLGLVGGAVDLGRAHLASMRLQQACDAAALAGRHAMTDGTVDSTVRTEATKFFNFNFPQGTFQTASFTPNITGAANSTVVVTASTTIPMALMKFFGFATLPLSTTCNAKMDLVNTDIVLVLDNTGSMKCSPSASATSQCATEVTRSKMQGERDAVMALYDSLSDEQAQLEAAGLRMRYGIVPYSGTVNVGKLMYGLNNNYIRNPSNYQQCNSWNRNNRCTGYASASVTHPSSFFSGALSSWGGCIEEAATVNTITSGSGYTIPSGAKDMNIDLVPSAGDNTTQWAAYDEASEQADDQTACPAQAVPLKAFTRADLLTYVNGLAGDGGTYSDVGMIWGGRFLSSIGVYSALNPITYGGMPVNKFIILVTDGYIDTGDTYYGAWGVEYYDHRVSADPYPGETVDTANHKQRFSMVCNAVKGASVSIWVVGFGASVGTLDSALTGCASNANQALVAADSDTLKTQFQRIGSAIGALRLTQ